MEYMLLSYFLALAFGVLTTEGGECPANPTASIQACADKVKIDLNIAEGHRFITDGEYTDKMCEGEEVNKALTCMETIYKDCLESAKEEKDMLVKPTAWREAIKLVCDNRKFLADNADCVMKGKADMEKCIMDLQKQAKANATLVNIDMASKGKKKQREQFMILCRLSNNMRTCFDKTLLKNCPAKMETIIDDIIYKFLPPICHPVAGKTSYTHVDDGSKDPENGAVKLSAVATMTVAVAMCLRSMI